MKTRRYRSGGWLGRWALVACCVTCLLPGLAAATSQGAHSSQPGKAPPADAGSPYLSDWFHQHVQLVGETGARYGPTHIDDIYLEYEFSGTKGPFDLYGYVDAHKILGIGNANDRGFWDGGSPLFTELEPRLSFDRLLGRDLGIGPIKQWYLATDYILDVGNGRDSRQNTLYFGPGASFNTHSRVNFELNFFFRRQFANYGAPNSFSWDGYRLQPNVIVPLTTLDGGKLTYVGYVNYDFGSHLGDDAGPTRTDHATVATNVLILSYTRLRYFFTARYFHNGGQWRDGATVDFGNGPRQLDQDGWAYYLAVGWKF